MHAFSGERGVVRGERGLRMVVRWMQGIISKSCHFVVTKPACAGILVR